LASCMSTSQFASRKYTKGHFSDPIAKVNVDLIPSGSNTPNTVAQVSPSKTVSTQNTKTTKVAVVETKNTAPKQGLTFTTKEKSVKVAVGAPAATYKDNVSLSENSVTGVTDHHGDGGGDEHHGYLWKALVCLLVAILLTILAAVVAVGGAIGLGAVLYIFAVIFWIAFLVFCVLAILRLFA
jgi:hypothetical protein